MCPLQNYGRGFGAPARLPLGSLRVNDLRFFLESNPRFHREPMRRGGVRVEPVWALDLRLPTASSVAENKAAF